MVAGTAVPGAWQMEDDRRLPPATLRHLTAIWKPGFSRIHGLQEPDSHDEIEMMLSPIKTIYVLNN